MSIAKGKIVDIQKKVTKPSANAIIIDLHRKWLLPGFIDAHVHVNFEQAKTALQSGVTTARTMGGGEIDLRIRSAHRLGNDSLPDIVAAGYQLRPDMSETFYGDFPQFTDLKPKVSGVENLRLIVKALVSHKVDLIKILATERAGTPETDPLKRTFTDEEIAAIVDEADKAGIPVAAHAHADDGAYAAVKAGVRSIEHGTFLSNQTLALMKSKGTYYVPTFSGWDETPSNPNNINNPILAERKRTFQPAVMEVTRRAYKMGIPIVCGTDTRYSEPGHTMADEAQYLHKAGMPAMDVIKAMTYTSAQCLGVQHRTGSIKKGMEADLVILKQSPLKDLSALHDILMVVNDGQIVVNKMRQ
ncbi:MAG TPA: amidohydrolase family protein [Chitinophagaceae bacterium]|nr:amidohydrolase family protein [Chitinophagaceae bacterium]